MDTWDTSLPVPLDILLDILVLLPLRSVLALRRTSKRLCALTHLRVLWLLLFRTHVLDQHIPFPDLGPSPLADLSAHALESLTRRALSLRRIWASPSPLPRRRITFDTPTERSTRVVFLQFLPGRSNRWLISVRTTVQPRCYLLQCWDVATDPPRPVAALTHADGPYGGVVLNPDPTSSSVLAMQSAQTETFSIDFDARDPECAFVTQATIDGIRGLHLLSGSTLITRSLDDGGPLCLWDLSDLRQEKLQLLNPSLVQPDDRVQAIHITYDHALVVRLQSIEIYSTTPHPSPLSARGPPISYPLVQFKFQWPTDTVVLCEQHASPSSRPALPPMHLLVRFGSIYPWPVNILHHYLLLPNPTYHTGSSRAHSRRGRSTPASTSRSPSATSPYSPFSACTSECNLPYDPHPYHSHTISSPVRLFGPSAMVFGRYGTALWLDSHTEEWLGPSDHGQRLAGRVFQYNDGEMPTVAAAVDGVTEPITTANSSDASTVFDICDDDAWTRIAMEEEAGRIALGHTDGAITLLEY